MATISSYLDDHCLTFQRIDLKNRLLVIVIWERHIFHVLWRYIHNATHTCSCYLVSYISLGNESDFFKDWVWEKQQNMSGLAILFLLFDIYLHTENIFYAVLTFRTRTDLHTVSLYVLSTVNDYEGLNLIWEWSIGQQFYILKPYLPISSLHII